MNFDEALTTAATGGGRLVPSHDDAILAEAIFAVAVTLSEHEVALSTGAIGIEYGAPVDAVRNVRAMIDARLLRALPMPDDSPGNRATLTSEGRNWLATFQSLDGVKRLQGIADERSSAE
jgi:hypothetical protein